jgi:hypothetical protein
MILPQFAGRCFPSFVWTLRDQLVAIGRNRAMPATFQVEARAEKAGESTVTKRGPNTTQYTDSSR